MAAAAASLGRQFCAGPLGKRISASVLSQPAYRRIQVRPGYGTAGMGKEVTMEDLRAEIRLLRTSMKQTSESGQNTRELERRLTRLEAIVAVGGVVLGGVLELNITQPGAINKMVLDQDSMRARLLCVEDNQESIGSRLTTVEKALEEISPVAPRSLSSPTRAPTPHQLIPPVALCRIGIGRINQKFKCQLTAFRDQLLSAVLLCAVATIFAMDQLL